MDRTKRIGEILVGVTKNSCIPGIEQSLFESGYIDSFSIVDVVSELERAFGVKIPDRDLTPKTFDSILHIQQYLDRVS
jgi:acyl carrier protein